MTLLQSLKAIPMISDNILVNPEMIRSLKKAMQYSSILSPFQDIWITYLLLIFEKLNPEELNEILERLKLNRRIKSSLESIQSFMHTHYKSLLKTQHTEKVYYLLRILIKLNCFFLVFKSSGRGFQKSCNIFHTINIFACIH